MEVSNLFHVKLRKQFENKLLLMYYSADDVVTLPCVGIHVDVGEN